MSCHVLQMTIIKQKLDLKKKETEAFQERMRELSEEFTKEFSGHDFFDFLLKVFKMKVKKLKKKLLKGGVIVFVIICNFLFEQSSSLMTIHLLLY